MILLNAGGMYMYGPFVPRHLIGLYIGRQADWTYFGYEQHGIFGGWAYVALSLKSYDHNVWTPLK